MWFEDLPANCPPEDAAPPDNEFYRLAEGDPATCRDFWSHRKIWPNKVFNVSECRAKSISVFANAKDLEKVKMLQAHAGKAIVKIKLTPCAGLIKQTGNDLNHYSWWRFSTFDPIQATVTVG